MHTNKACASLDHNSFGNSEMQERRLQTHNYKERLPCNHFDYPQSVRLHLHMHHACIQRERVCVLMCIRDAEQPAVSANYVEEVEMRRKLPRGA